MTKNQRIVDELAEALGLKNSYEFQRKSKFSSATISRLNNGGGSKSLRLMSCLALLAIQHMPERKKAAFLKEAEELFES